MGSGVTGVGSCVEVCGSTVDSSDDGETDNKWPRAELISASRVRVDS